MRVMIADDHPLFAEGLRNLLASNDFELVEIVRNGKKVIEEALKERPDVILMDIEMPIVNGIEATRQIKEKAPEIQIIILTSFEEEDSLFKAIKVGASGYLLKSLDGGELVQSLREIEQGKRPFSPGLEEYLLGEIRDTNKKVENSLTERQLEVIKLLVKGFTYQEIGSQLFLSERTIKYHMEQIKERLALNSQAQVIAYARNKLDIK